MKIAMLGLGSMNGAILEGLLASGTAQADVVATVRSAASAQRQQERFRITVLSEEQDPDANVHAVEGADVVLLGVKPPQISGLCAEIRSALAADAVVVSVAAAVQLETMQRVLANQPVIRTMPNTPVAVGSGVVGISPGEYVSDGQLQAVKGLFEASANVYELPESQLEALTGVAGSGPAYAFYLAEHMAAAGVRMGLDAQTAAALAADTIAGAGRMLTYYRSGDNPLEAADLRAQVTSPNGTTHQAIETFNAHGMDAAITAGAEASAARAAELSRELS